MMEYLKKDLINLFKLKNVDVNTFASSLKCLSFNDALKSIEELFKTSFEEIINDPEFISSYFSLISNLAVQNKGDIEVSIINHINYIKKLATNYCKPYNKKEKKKDHNFNASKLLKMRCDDLAIFIANRTETMSSKYEKYNIISFIINKLKTPDYLFRIMQINPDYLNARDSYGHHVFVNTCEYFINNVGKMDEETVKYYKRVIVMMLENENLTLKNEEISNLIKLCDIVENSENIELVFLKNAIRNHYPIINTYSKRNCVDYCFYPEPTILINSSFDENLPKGTIDLTDLFTVSIDGNRHSNLTNVLFDDAFSIYRDGQNNHLLIHIPDVDRVIKRDTELDKFMRHLGKSVYATGYKKPLLDFQIADELSLKQNAYRYAITFDITMDDDANIKNVDFYRSLIRVNYNIHKNKADAFIKYGYTDEKLGMLRKVKDLMIKSARKRKEKTAGKSSAKIILDEINVLPDLVSAKFALENDIPFAFKNYLGKHKVPFDKHVLTVNDFINSESLSPEGIEVLNSIFDIYYRVYYDTMNIGNKSFHDEACGNVGNPLRDYLSLESDRLLGDIVIDGCRVYDKDYWKERILNDSIEFTETSSKLNELYGLKRGR